MALKVRSNRSKSTSDILDEVAKKEGTTKGNSFLVNNQYRTYTSEDLRSERKCFMKDSTYDGKKQQSAQKSQNFVKKLIASLEKRNEACKANDEFFTKLYRKNEYSNTRADYSLDRKHQFSREAEIIEKEIPPLYIETDKSTLPNDKTNRNSNFDVFAENKVPVFPNIKQSKQFATKNDNLEESKFRVSREEENNLEVDKQQNKKYNERNCNVIGNNERKKFLEPSFDPNSRVEPENQIDIANSYFLKRTDKRKKSTLERILINSKGDEKSKKRIFNGTSKKKLNRNKSFKNLLGSMIKWKKSEGKDRSRYFMSCDHLLFESESCGSENDKKLTRPSSFPAVVFQEFEEENLKENTERKATIRPIYGGKRNDQHFKVFTKKKENRKFFIMEESVEDLVKPSHIKNIAKHLS